MIPAREAIPRALARSASVGSASRSSREWVTWKEISPRWRLSRVTRSDISTSPGATRRARHSSSWTRTTWRRCPSAAAPSIIAAAHAQEHSIAAATTSSSSSSSAEMSSDIAGVSRSAVTDEGRSNMPRIAP